MDCSKWNLPLTSQQIYDLHGFIVLAYESQAELAADDAQGFAENIQGELWGVRMRIVGEATRAEWDRQELLSGDWGEACYIAFRKVMSE